MFEVRALLCLFGFVIGAFQEGETGMRCGAIALIPQLPPQLLAAFAIQTATGLQAWEGGSPTTASQETGR